jgi:hypothetical protein
MPEPAFSKRPLSVFDPLKDVNELTTRRAAEIVAVQLNDQTLNGNRAQGAISCPAENLSPAIVDIVLDWVAQGASTLTLQLIDPEWQLLTRWGDRPAFIDVDDSGLLIPVDVNYPEGTDCWWRLVQASPSIDMTQANIQLTFEDKIASLLRDVAGPKHAGSGMSRAQFIYSCVKTAPGLRFVCPALYKPVGAVAGDVSEQQAERLENGVNTTGIVSPSNDRIAKSARQSAAPAARRNPAKRSGLTLEVATKGAVWTKGGWRYTRSINGVPPKVLNLLNPPTDVKDNEKNS